MTVSFTNKISVIDEVVIITSDNEITYSDNYVSTSSLKHALETLVKYSKILEEGYVVKSPDEPSKI